MHRVPGVADRVDQGDIEWLVDLGAQAAHMGFDDGGVGFEIEIPDPFQQHRARDHPARVAHQDFQHREFFGMKFDQFALPGGRARQKIKMQVMHVKRIGIRCIVLAAGDGCDPGQKFGKVERFDQIVVAPRRQPFDAIIDLTHRGQEQYRQILSRSPQRPQHRKTIHPGHHPIQDGHVAIVVKTIAKRIAAIGHMIDAMAVFDQTGRDVFGHLQIIFGQKDFHMRLRNAGADYASGRFQPAFPQILHRSKIGVNFAGDQKRKTVWQGGLWDASLSEKPQMNTLDHAQGTEILRSAFSKRLMIVGIVFAVIGGLAILLPAWATLAGELLIAWMLVLWGAAGLWFAWEMRPAQEWRYAAAAFGVTFLLGLVFLLFPGAGIETLTIVIVMVFLIEGIVSILLGLRISARLRQLGLDDLQRGVFADRRHHHPDWLAGNGCLDAGAAAGGEFSVDRTFADHAVESGEGNFGMTRQSSRLRAIQHPNIEIAVPLLSAANAMKVLHKLTDLEAGLM